MPRRFITPSAKPRRSALPVFLPSDTDSTILRMEILQKIFSQPEGNRSHRENGIYSRLNNYYAYLNNVAGISRFLRGLHRTLRRLLTVYTKAMGQISKPGEKELFNYEYIERAPLKYLYEMLKTHPHFWHSKQKTGLFGRNCGLKTWHAVCYNKRRKKRGPPRKNEGGYHYVSDHPL